MRERAEERLERQRGEKEREGREGREERWERRVEEGKLELSLCVC